MNHFSPFPFLLLHLSSFFSNSRYERQTGERGRKVVVSCYLSLFIHEWTYKNEITGHASLDITILFSPHPLSLVHFREEEEEDFPASE